MVEKACLILMIIITVLCFECLNRLSKVEDVQDTSEEEIVVTCDCTHECESNDVEIEFVEPEPEPEPVEPEPDPEPEEEVAIVPEEDSVVMAFSVPEEDEDELTMYDVYSAKELDLLFRVVQSEAGIGDIECRSHVASVIFNRVKAGIEGGDLTAILTAPKQFSVISNGAYQRVVVDEKTIKACEIAFKMDTAMGALYFDSTDGNSWAHNNRQFLFKDEIGHCFYE